MALTLSGTNGIVGAGFSITPGGAVAGIVTVGAAVTISESGVNVVGVGTFSGAISAGAASNIVGGLTIDAGNSDTGLSMDVSGSGNYVIKESSSDDVMQYGSGASSCYKHNFSSGMVSVNNGHGSVADFYPCRGWCNISGDSSPAAVIRRSTNFSAITDNGSGDYTLTFTNAGNNWSTAQTVTVTVPSDLTSGTDKIPFNITLSVVDASSDNNFDNASDKIVIATMSFRPPERRVNRDIIPTSANSSAQSSAGSATTSQQGASTAQSGASTAQQGETSAQQGASTAQSGAQSAASSATISAASASVASQGASTAQQGASTAQS